MNQENTILHHKKPSTHLGHRRYLDIQFQCSRTHTLRQCWHTLRCSHICLSQCLCTHRRQAHIVRRQIPSHRNCIEMSHLCLHKYHCCKSGAPTYIRRCLLRWKHWHVLKFSSRQHLCKVSFMLSLVHIPDLDIEKNPSCLHNDAFAIRGLPFCIRRCLSWLQWPELKLSSRLHLSRVSFMLTSTHLPNNHEHWREPFICVCTSAMVTNRGLQLTFGSAN